MKLTKNKLKSIILEELYNIMEDNGDEGGLSTAPAGGTDIGKRDPVVDSDADEEVSDPVKNLAALRKWLIGLSRNITGMTGLDVNEVKAFVALCEKALKAMQAENAKTPLIRAMAKIPEV